MFEQKKRSLSAKESEWIIRKRNGKIRSLLVMTCLSAAFFKAVVQQLQPAQVLFAEQSS